MRYPKECVLKDCEEVVIRPIKSDDRVLLNDFYTQIPESDRWLMNYDVMDPIVMDKWFRAVEKGNVACVLSFCEDCVVGQGSLYMKKFGATSHVGRLRITVLPQFRQKRLGTWLLLDLIQLAMDQGLEMLRADLAGDIENNVIEALKKFDFFKYAELENSVKDFSGYHHNLVIMIKRMHQNWSDF